MTYPATCERREHPLIFAIVTIIVALESLRQALLGLLLEFIFCTIRRTETTVENTYIKLSSIVIDTAEGVSPSMQSNDQEEDPAFAKKSKKDTSISPADSDTDCSSEISDWDFWGDESAFSNVDQVVHVRSDMGLVVSDYLCPCGECPLYPIIEERVMKCCVPPSSKGALCQILQAFSTYNEVVGFQPSMIPKAQRCLSQHKGDIDAAFQSFIALVET
ncbi:hypothetical protein AeRB84_015567 [Aphanomyces euteiches]|nr:hypothetical protein AeRB84_015567 [Aphanomyces euteiches]